MRRHQRLLLPGRRSHRSTRLSRGSACPPSLLRRLGAATPKPRPDSSLLRRWNTWTVTASPSLVVNTAWPASSPAHRRPPSRLKRQRLQRSADVVHLVVLQLRMIRGLRSARTCRPPRANTSALSSRPPREAIRSWPMFMMSRSSQSAGSASPAGCLRRARSGSRPGGGHRPRSGTLPWRAHAAMADDHAPSIGLPDASSTRSRSDAAALAVGILHAEAAELRGIGGARFDQAQFRQPGQQAAQLGLLHRVVVHRRRPQRYRPASRWPSSCPDG